MVPNVMAILQRFTTGWAALLPPEAILAACGEAGSTTGRDRVLTLVPTIQVFRWQMVPGHTACSHLPLDSTANLQPRWPGETYRQTLRSSGQFGELQEVRTSWMRRYPGEEYLKLLWTFSDHRAMPEPNRSQFFEEISRVIAQMGGEVIRDHETLALLAKKR